MQKHFYIVLAFLATTFTVAGTKPRFIFSHTRFSDKLPSGIASTYHAVQQGFDFTTWLSDQGTMGLTAATSAGYKWYEVIGSEYPAGSGNEHLTFGELWVGALVDVGSPGLPHIVKRVTGTASSSAVGPSGLIFPTSAVDTAHPWQHRSRSNFNRTNYCISGSDSEAISESDYTFEYTDTNRSPLLDHWPLGIKFLQRSYAWVNAVREPILPFDYYFINVGTQQLKNVYIGFHFALAVNSNSTTDTRNFAGYFNDVHTGYVSQSVDDGSTPMGITILAPPKPWRESQYYSFHWYKPGWNYCPGCLTTACEEGCRYDLMSGALFPSQPPIQPDQPMTEDLTVDFLLFSFGPLDTWNPGETLKVSMALVSGFNLRYGRYNLHDNAVFAHTLYDRHYIPPVTLPPPKLRIEPGFRRVTLRWGYDGTGVNPMDVWDGESRSAELYPPGHWRRTNPPSGCTRGGRIFEGYRLYRSEDPAGSPSSFSLFRQWDMIDSAGPQFGYDAGIETTFVDSNLTQDKAYWYSVTSFTILDISLTELVDSLGNVRVETLRTQQGAESDVLASRKRVYLPFSVSHDLGKVLVVPNPYRVDDYYTFENSGWEGRGRTWNENKRLIKFIHLPPKCTIRIFSLSGDIVATLYHEDPYRGEESWNLLSDSNRAIASGVYAFSVESELGTQIGKFVIIR